MCDEEDNKKCDSQDATKSFFTPTFHEEGDVHDCIASATYGRLILSALYSEQGTVYRLMGILKKHANTTRKEQINWQSALDTETWRRKSVNVQ